MYFLLGISLMLILLVVINLLLSATATFTWHILVPSAKNWTAQRRAQVIFALRIFPFAATLISVFAFLLPAYFLFESYSTKETVGFKMASLACFSASGVLIAAYRLFGTVWRTRRLTANWLAHAEPISIRGVKIPVYRFSHSFPVIAVVGTFRPQIFVAGQIFDTLGDEEFQAAIRHEYGHITARDNLKRTLMRTCRDLLVFPIGNSLDSAWEENAEAAADEYAARTGGVSAALNLASALIKIARLIPPGTKPAMPAGAYLIETHTVDVTWRVRYLLQLAEIKFIPAKYRLFITGNIFLLIAGVSFVLVSLLAADDSFLYKVHLASEIVVSFLQ